MMTYESITNFIFLSKDKIMQFPLSSYGISLFVLFASAYLSFYNTQKVQSMPQKFEKGLKIVFPISLLYLSLVCVVRVYPESSISDMLIPVIQTLRILTGLSFVYMLYISVREYRKKLIRSNKK